MFFDRPFSMSRLSGGKLRESWGSLKAMDKVTLRAHFDGQKICLDEPFEMEPNTDLIITVLPKRSTNQERADWIRLSQQSLATAYGEDEAEYSLDQIKTLNPEYEGE